MFTSWRTRKTGTIFLPDEFKKKFNLEITRIDVSAAVRASLLVLLLTPVFYIIKIDYLFTPSNYKYFLFIRLIIMGVAAIGFILSQKPSYARFAKIITFTVLCVTGWGVDLMVRELGYDSPYYAGLNLVYLGSLLVPWGGRWTFYTCVFVYLGYLLPILFFDLDKITWLSFINNNLFQLCTIVIVTVASHFHYHTRRIELVNRLTIAQQAEELEERDKYKREFISNITHELKTPLSVVIGNVDLIMESIGERDDAVTEQARQVQQAAFQLANHVDRIIAVSKIDDPTVKLDLQNYNYCGVVQNLFSIFDHKARAEKITYTLNCPEKPLVVNVDIIKIEEVLTNLIQNAFKFTDEDGSVTVTVASDGQQVITEVADTGVGISEEKQANIFDRMFQADGVLSKRHGGMGLGLYIVKKNIEMHGGTVEVGSREGKGTSFKYTLPLHIDQTVPVKNEHGGEECRPPIERRSGRDRRADERRRTFEYQQSMGIDDLARMSFTGNIDLFENMNPSHPSILIVEDNPGMMKVVIEALRGDYNLLLGRDAFEALEKLDTYSGKVSLILSDIMMPGMSGFDFCGKVMENSEWKRIPLIFITALMSEEDQLKGFGLGATDYITKPYNIKILKEKVNHWISRRQYETILKNMSQELEVKVKQISRARDIILHEIRNPMAVISTANQLIAKVKEKNSAGAGDPKINEYLGKLHQGVQSLNSVIETTRQLDFNAMGTRKPEYVNSIVQEVLSQSGHFIGAIRVVIDMDQSTDILVNADRQMLVQVLVNLIRNAAEAIGERDPPEGGSITIASSISDTNCIAIKISDNGIGMDENEREKIFRFKYTTKRDGTGIGLYLCKMMVKIHEGFIQVESTKGSGSTFTLSFPTC